MPFRNPFSSLRVRLVATVFVAIAPAALLLYLTKVPWMGFILGFLALVSAWVGGELFILRQVRRILDAAKNLAIGDLTSRTRLGDTTGELGELARAFDHMAASIENRSRESEVSQRTLSNRAQQQTVVAALGQFALVSQDLIALQNQAVTMIAQTLEVEFAHALELNPDGTSMLMRSGVGWKSGVVGTATIETRGSSQAGYVLASGEPVVISNMREERRFVAPPVLLEHGILSGIAVVISVRQRPYGVLGAYSKKTRVFTGDEINFMVAVGMALATAAERAESEAELHKLALFAQLNPNAALELTEDATITYFNDAALKLALSVNRVSPREVLPEEIQQMVQMCLLTGESRMRFESKIEGRTFSWSFHPVPASRVVHCYIEDITERLSLEAQLLQSQKMESVGQLAAGVAHDFNNMLTIIQGHSGMLMAKPNLPTELFDSAQAVYFASERAAGLTRQLLMFSRKNVIQRKPLDLREVVKNMIKLLQRSLGETVVLEFKPLPDMPVVFGDSGMVEQVIMNLAVNARDAMPRGGTLTLELIPVEVDQTYAVSRPEAKMGYYVCLRVSDTGVGMDEAVINRIFEPFFTTKEVGKGTGLGLATVYGIVKQHDGWIEVSSQPGVGTTFDVYFPASVGEAEVAKQETSPVAFVRGGKEVIMIVEDEPVLRDMAQLILEECGYRIFTASNGPEAIVVWEQKKLVVDLLLTDMVMPEGVSGVELAERLIAQKPQLKVVFASGYTVDEVSEAFLEKNNARFLQKPYTRTTLARAVRQALDQTKASGGQIAS